MGRPVARVKEAPADVVELVKRHERARRLKHRGRGKKKGGRNRQPKGRAN